VTSAHPSRGSMGGALVGAHRGPDAAGQTLVFGEGLERSGAHEARYPRVGEAEARWRAKGLERQAFPAPERELDAVNEAADRGDASVVDPRRTALHPESRRWPATRRGPHRARRRAARESSTSKPSAGARRRGSKKRVGHGRPIECSFPPPNCCACVAHPAASVPRFGGAAGGVANGLALRSSVEFRASRSVFVAADGSLN